MSELLSQKSKQSEKSLSRNGRLYGNHSFYGKARLYFKTEQVGPVDSAMNSVVVYSFEKVQEPVKVKKVKISSLKSNDND